jgi:hypothetical protein
LFLPDLFLPPKMFWANDRDHWWRTGVRCFICKYCIMRQGKEDVEAEKRNPTATFATAASTSFFADTSACALSGSRW